MVHQHWLQGRLRDGWRFAATADQAAKLHPNIVPYAQLAEPDKVPKRTLAFDTIKIILAAGLVFEEGGAVEADVVVQDIEIPPLLTEVVEILSFHAHEIWAVEKMKQGFRYAPVRNDTAK